VIDMALLSVIRRWHFRDEMPIREIERRTGLSRNTIRKYLCSGVVEPTFKVPDRPSKLDPFAEKLSGWLRTKGTKSRKQRRTARQMHTDLVVLGCDGLYGRVAAHVMAWKAERQREAQTQRARDVRAAGVRRRRSIPVRLASLKVIGTGRYWAAGRPSCRWQTPSFPTVAPSPFGLTRFRPTRCE
jgi:hypothetical protein